MDPQHRMLLESAGQLLSPSGLELESSGFGVFVGISWSEYSGICKSHGAASGPYAAQGAVLS